MQHLDDGIIHTLIDDELDAEARAEAEAHLAGCAGCSARLARERAIVGDALGLVESLDAPAAPGPAVAPGGAPATHGPPVVLFPTNLEAERRQLVRRRVLASAAMFVVAAGATWFALQGGSSFNGTVAPEPTRQAATPPPPTDTGTGSTATVAPPPAAPEAAAASAEETRVPAAPAAEREEGAREQAAPAPEEPAQERERTAAPMAGVTGGAVADAAVPPPARDEMAARQRVRQEEAAPAVATPPAPAPERDAPAAMAAAAEPETEARRTALSIGLDEAERHLGSRLHVIDGMSPSSVSVIPGTLVRGAAATRRVVRVTYRGVDGGEIHLDQQRMDGSGEDAGVFSASGWTVGNVRLRLTGDVTNDSLQVLMGRVR